MTRNIKVRVLIYWISHQKYKFSCKKCEINVSVKRLQGGGKPKRGLNLLIVPKQSFPFQTVEFHFKHFFFPLHKHLILTRQTTLLIMFNSEAKRGRERGGGEKEKETKRSVITAHDITDSFSLSLSLSLSLFLVLREKDI